MFIRSIKSSFSEAPHISRHWSDSDLVAKTRRCSKPSSENAYSLGQLIVATWKELATVRFIRDLQRCQQQEPPKRHPAWACATLTYERYAWFVVVEGEQPTYIGS